MAKGPLLPPDSCLLALILIVRTAEGTQDVFHYPQRPEVDHFLKKEQERHPKISDGLGLDEDPHHIYHRDTPIDHDQRVYRKPRFDFSESSSGSPIKNSLNMGKDNVPRDPAFLEEKFLGLPDAYHALLSPPRQFHKKRFELTIGNLVFLGRPIYSKIDGTWKNKPRLSDSSTLRKLPTIEEYKDANPMSETDEGGHAIDESDLDLSETDPDEDDRTTIRQDQPPIFNGKSHGNRNSPRTSQSEPQSSLHMFHVVFVMNPDQFQRNARVNAMYKHVVRKFSQALKWLQRREDFMAKEVEILRQAKMKTETSQANSSKSHLARVLMNLFSAISDQKIAQLKLTPKFSIALQIPLPTSTPELPGPLDTQLPGLWLTTATSIPEDDELYTNRSRLANHFALLPLAEISTILADIITTSSPLAERLSYYLSVSTPRKTFLQVSKMSGMPLQEIQILASHLIQWRRARAVPPLHKKDTYIVSPNADMSKVATASAQYARLFPTLPDLPKMLTLLSSKPRPYRYFIPSKDHQDVYLDILGWLLRGGWVTQLRTFAWVKVPAEIVAEIQGSHSKDDQHEDSETEDFFERSGDAEPKSRTSSGDNNSAPKSRPLSSLLQQQLQLAESPEEPAQSSNTSHISHVTSSSNDEAPTAPKSILITAPLKASVLESRYLAAISAKIAKTSGEETRDIWQRCLKYFNGEHALEKISVREGLKRKRVMTLRNEWIRQGYLVEARHW